MLKRDPATIGASDVALLVYWDEVLAGRQPPFRPYSGQGIVELYRRLRTGEVKDDGGSITSAGHYSERLVEQVATEMLGVPVRRWDKPVQHPTEERWYCTPDAKVDERWPGAEFKVVFDYERAQEWGAGAESIPAAYYWQLQWTMLVCDVERWHMLVRMAHGFSACAESDCAWCLLHDGEELLPFLAECKDLEVRHYEVSADQQKQERLVDLVEMFFEFYVDVGLEPEPVGLKADTAALRDLAVDGEPRLPENAAEETLIDDLELACQEFRDAKERKERLRQQLQVAAHRTGDSGIVDTEGRGVKETSSGSLRVQGL